METADSDDGVTEVGPSLNAGTGNAVVSGGNTGTQKSMKTEQENISACSSANSFGSMVSMAPTTVLNQGGHLPPGVMTVPPPSSCPEQIVVAMQNMNGATGVEDGDPKALVNSGSMNNSIHMPKLNYTMANTNSLSTMATSGPMLAPTQLANMMSLAGLPQVTALTGLNGVTGLNVVSQLAAPAQMMQQIHQPTAGVATACVSNTALPGTCPPNMVATANGQPHAVQQVQQPQMAGTPQFILAAGQPIQGIQGAQLLIPTSSGVATQQVITIPVSQLAGNQVVQLVASNGQIFTTTLANLQALSQPVPVPGITPTNIASNPQAIQPHQVLSTASYTNIPGQMTALPQIFTNPAGQLVAFGPQIIAHPLMSTNQNGNVLVNPQLAAGPHVQQIPQQEDKSSAVPPAAHSNGQPAAIQARVQNASMSAISQALAMHQQPQTAPIAMNAVTMVTSQLAAQPKPQTNGQPCPVASKLPVQPGTVSTLTQTVQPQAAITPDDNDPDNCLNQAVNTISNTEANVVDGINLEEIKEFAKAFKIRRLSLGLTQTQVGQALSATEGPSYSQSAICRFEKLDITPRSAQKIKPVLERWMKEAEERYKNGAHTLTEFIGSESTKKRKRRTSFTPAALEVLNQFFEKNTHPTGVEMTELAEHLLYDREVVRVWFCNKRQALKNTIKKLKASSGPSGVQCS